MRFDDPARCVVMCSCGTKLGSEEGPEPALAAFAAGTATSSDVWDHANRGHDIRLDFFHLDGRPMVEPLTGRET